MRCSSFIFKENHVFIEEEDNLSVVLAEEELDGWCTWYWKLS